MQHLSATQIDRICLWHLLQHSLSSYQKICQHFPDLSLALRPNSLDVWQNLNIHKNHIQRFQHHFTAEGQHNFQQRLATLSRFCDDVVFDDDLDYPQLLQPYTDKPPMLFVRGDAQILNHTQIAIVGSRQSSPHGAKIAFDFADYFAQQGLVSISGLAAGIDAAAHRGAIQHGKTIAVIATGLDECYPSEHLSLWQNIIDTGGAIISEFLPFTPPAKQNFPRRNRIISGMSQGTLVIEATEKSGSLITAKTAAEQGKQVFATPGHIYSLYHKGCHQLIREGAILVDHPSQVLEDLSTITINRNQLKPLPKTTATHNPDLASSPTTPQTPASPDIPEHLQAIYQALDWNGIALDELSIQLNLGISDLNVALLELELLGLCKQHGGRYLRL